MTRRVLAILRREAVPLLVYTLVVLPLGVALSFCLIGVPVIAHGLAQIVSALVRGARREHGRAFEPEPSAGWAGALATSAVAALSGTTILASWACAAVLGDDHTLAQILTGLVAAALTGAALAPFALAPIIAAAGVEGLVRPLGRSVELAVRIDARRLASLGAAGGALVGGALVAFAQAIASEAHPLVIFAAALAILTGIVSVLALLADAFVRSAPPAASVELRAPRRLRTLALILVPLLLIPSAASIVAALTPTPMRPRGDAPFPRGHYRDRWSLEEPRNLVTLPLSLFEGERRAAAHVRDASRGVFIEARDGGGAGHVRAGFELGGAGEIFVEEGHLYGGPPDSFAVFACDGDTEAPYCAYTVVDRNGVRLDDSLGDRVLGRLGILGGTALALALVLLLVLTWRLGVSLGEARTLDAPDLDAPGKGGRKGLLGTLSITKSATLTRARGSIRIAGEAWIDADGLRIRVPERTIPALGELDRDPHEGQPIVLVSRFKRALTTNLREAGTQWPDDGLLILGTHAEASDALTRRATTAAAWIALPLAACVFTATAALLISL